MDMYGFYTGQILDAYEWLGAHVCEGGVVFRTFAPSAQRVELILNDQYYEMNRAYDGNYYEVYVAGAKAGDLYEYGIGGQNGVYTRHCDPYGFGMELRPAHRSIVRDLHAYQFADEDWMRRRGDGKDRPINIYEMHLGSWRRPVAFGDEWYSYEELGELLVPYLKETGYNYVEFLPISEHPCDESWGYQNTGFYAPTSRYGTMDGLKAMIDHLHQHGIGVILDFVPVHFATDDYGLGQYDGTALYEYPHSDVGVSEWGSYNFMHSRGEVRSFLQSCANYWLREYHFDGLRMDAISRIIYWHGDPQRGVNGNAVDFIKVMNKGLKAWNPGCMLIAEDSTNYPNVTGPVDNGGLGFDYKWDMGWMHDTLEYFQTGPEYRSRDYHKLTFSMMYYYNERYLLPFSHDEVVHGKATILQKMNGDYDGKFPQGRALYVYMMLHPGKKLLFMGNEIGQLREWDEKREQDWMLRDYPIHDAFYRFMCDLNQLYLEHPAFYLEDYAQDGFRWIDCHQEARCVYVIERRCADERVIGILNLSDRQQAYRMPEPLAEDAEVLLYTDYEQYGGTTPEDAQICVTVGDALSVTLAPFSAVLIRG